ncbi:hypothetical protein FRB96_002932 [Tulasnella sp. 330]|nr:hypothetical protein FRB96_002932 [Tulasnella sp. 330]KAG8879009.1 hypothetical protein FRB98_005871 [Tulasnella sp. 332]
MPVKVAESPYPLIDADPHAFRVVRFMRPSDYAVLAGGTAAAPGILYAMERIDPSRGPMRPALKLAGLLGFVGGFLLAYQRSTFRFWGWTENGREQAKDLAELTQRAREGKPLYGQSDLEPYLQGVAHRNSAFSQLKLSSMPWFNLVNHPHHGTDPAKYGVKSESSSPESQ